MLRPAYADGLTVGGRNGAGGDSDGVRGDFRVPGTGAGVDSREGGRDMDRGRGRGRGSQMLSVPRLEVGTELGIHSLALTDGETRPPGYLSESELIGLMEKHGIGTDASIASHINNIQARDYVSLGGGRTLVPTQLGTALIHGYRKIDPELVLPTVRAAIEAECGKIAKGEADAKAVLQHALSVFEAKFRYFVSHLEAMDELFEATFTPLGKSGQPFTRCGRCRKVMTLISSRPARLFCPTCNETLSLPQDGVFQKHGGKRCPLDGFELLYFSLGRKSTSVGRSFVLCPYCYANPPFESGARSGMGCDQCLHPDCEHGLVRHAVVPCPRGLVDGVR